MLLGMSKRFLSQWASRCSKLLSIAGITTFTLNVEVFGADILGNIGRILDATQAVVSSRYAYAITPALWECEPFNSNECWLHMSSGFYVVDVMDPDNPRVAGIFQDVGATYAGEPDVGFDATDLVLTGNYVLVLGSDLDFNWGPAWPVSVSLHVFDVSVPSEPRVSPCSEISGRQFSGTIPQALESPVTMLTLE
jgi:hypothetical protein